MKYLITFLSTFMFLQLNAGKLKGENIKMMTGKIMNLNQMDSKAILVVNIATQCGHTPQLSGLEALNKKYAKRGLTIIGVPSNDFGGQTPQNNKDVKKFCKLNYGVSFPLTVKIKVSGKDKHPLFERLISSSKQKDEIQWNFEKFLVNNKGQVVNRFGSSTKPNDKALIKAIEDIL